MSLPVDLPLVRLPSLLIAWEVHCKGDLSSTLPHDLGENDQGRNWLELEDASKGESPSLTLFPYLPSIFGIAPDSTHQALSHCYSVHPRLPTHHPSIYLYPSSILTLWDGLTRTLWHRVGGCNPCILHINIPLNPTSNFGRLLHLWHHHP